MAFLQPALKLLGRKWHIATDDLPLPSLMGAIWHIGVLILNSINLSFVVEQLDSSCPYRGRYIAYLSSHQFCFVVNSILHVWTFFESSRGSIFQVHRRRRVAPLVLAIMHFYCLTVASNVYGTHLLQMQTHTPQCQTLPGRLELNHYALLSTIVVATWVSLFIGFLAIIVTLNFFSTYQAASNRWLSRLKLYRLVFCCWGPCGDLAGGSTSRGGGGNDDDDHADDGRSGSGNLADASSGRSMSPMVVIANALSHVFGGVDMTLTDYVAAFTLLGVRHSQTKPALTYANAPPPTWLTAAAEDGSGAPLSGGGVAPWSLGGVRGRPPGDNILEAVMEPPMPVEVEVAPTGDRFKDAGCRGGQLPVTCTAKAAAGTEVAVAEHITLQATIASTTTATIGTITTITTATTTTSTSTKGIMTAFPTHAVNNANGTANAPTTVHTTIIPTTSTPSTASESATSRGVYAFGNASGTASLSTTAAVAAAATATLTPSVAPPAAANAINGADASSAPGQRPTKGEGSTDGSSLAGVKEAVGAAPVMGGLQALVPRPEGGHAAEEGQREGQQRQQSGAGFRGPQQQRRWESEDPNVQPNATEAVMEEALHYMRFATAVYGWKMYLWMNRRRVANCCRLCVGRGCGCCRQSSYFIRAVGPDYGPSEGCCTAAKLLEREAITQLTGVSDDDILYVCYDNRVGGLLPYYIALDRQRRSVVVGIRGSLSLSDVVTDLLCEPAEYDVPGLPSTDDCGRRVLWAHRGILESTRAILRDMRAQGVLQAALSTWPEGPEGQQALLQRLPSERARAVATRLKGAAAGFRVVITGRHVTVWVAVWRGCWAAEITHGMCISLVHAKDLISRLGVRSVERLVQDLVTAGAHSRVSKVVIMGRLILMGQRPPLEQLLPPDTALDPELQRALDDSLNRSHSNYNRGSRTPELVAEQFAGARDFVPPGHILYMERHKPLDLEEAPCCRCNLCTLNLRAHNARYVCRWIQIQDLMEVGLVVSRSMFSDHLPDRTLIAMETVRTASVMPFCSFEVTHGWRLFIKCVGPRLDLRLVAVVALAVAVAAADGSAGGRMSRPMALAAPAVTVAVGAAAVVTVVVMVVMVVVLVVVVIMVMVVGGLREVSSQREL
ncbi:hypothetical protein VOLCADRAFT_95936 [Volvox carteri f. nagariensis]|uniref:Uncharacterized protein n=1 Tax=Volvox carteri f. nagariensis TaxID=3068 RepID=D8U8S1_VOLCA|nr:uncharacterized protein VOLCADRAFT_95936 [Volvox carteri f. nagariensis]EFJ43798.1 hypothetical protein VOLCADRAFT_95936 [Volvox carteri f. nagariensis]|eukprot:XP_002955044.1 hypothetical protein VOLCADRAFT_95936 [Volvox carteri f. nagariensis]